MTDFLSSLRPRSFVTAFCSLCLCALLASCAATDYAVHVEGGADMNAQETDGAARPVMLLVYQFTTRSEVDDFMQLASEDIKSDPTTFGIARHSLRLRQPGEEFEVSRQLDDGPTKFEKSAHYVAVFARFDHDAASRSADRAWIAIDDLDTRKFVINQASVETAPRGDDD